jgi:hypothetical protein
MESEEIEYQCSECGSVVQADSKLCPGCGTSLEEILEEQGLEQFHITSNLADIAAIELDLDMNNIEHSIQHDTLGFVFGLTMAQSSILIVYNDKADLTKKILNDFEVDNSGFRSNTHLYKNSVNGVEGWLLFFSLSLLILFPAEIIYSTIEYIDIIRDEIKWIGLQVYIIDIIFVLDVIIVIFALYSGQKLLRIRPRAVRTAILFLNLYLVYSILITLFFIIIGEFLVPYDEGFTPNIVGWFAEPILFVTVWKMYLRESRRVKNTYGDFSNTK